MANNLLSPTIYSNVARENQLLSFNGTLTASPSIANPLLRIRNGSTTLVEFALHASTPLLGGSVDGSAVFSFIAPNAIAVGGAATVPDNYQVIGRDNAVHLGGEVFGGEGITIGQTVLADTITAIAPGG